MLYTHTNNIIYSFDGTYAYGGSGYGYIFEGEDIDGDEDMDAHNAYGGS